MNKVGRFVLLAVASALLLSAASPVSAEVRVDGRPEAVHLEVRDASLLEVLAALHERFNLRYRSSEALQAQTTGVFDGSLRRVAARLLDGYDYAMRVTPEGIDLLVLRPRQGGTSVAAVAPASAVRPPLTAAERRHFERGHLR
jgi:hypothetical protein